MTMQMIGIAGSGSGGVYRPVNRDKILSDVFPVVVTVTSYICSVSPDNCDTFADYVEIVMSQAQYFRELVELTDDLNELCIGVDNGDTYVYTSPLAIDIFEYAQAMEGESVDSDEELLDVFADSVATEMGKHKKQYNGIAVEDLVEHEKANYRIVPDQDGNGAYFKRKDQVEAAPVRVSTEVPDPWESIQDD